MNQSPITSPTAMGACRKCSQLGIRFPHDRAVQANQLQISRMTAKIPTAL